MSAREMLEAAGVDTTEESWATFQIAKVHEDLAYRLESVKGHAILTLATSERQVSMEFFRGAHALRKAKGRLGRLKRGEEAAA